jgi:hypothetical protein
MANMPPEECLASGKRGYIVVTDVFSFITFGPCGVTSYSKDDIRHRYCVRCHCFITDESETLRLTIRKGTPRWPLL